MAYNRTYVAYWLQNSRQPLEYNLFVTELGEVGLWLTLGNLQVT
jgi:hypothetical protein